MSRRATIPVDPDLLKWARESAGLSEPQVAKRIGLKEAPRYAAWEATGRPTPRQLEKLADASKRPVVAFFLPERPKEKPAPTDFRLARGAGGTELSTQLRLVIRRARRIVRIYEDLGGGRRPPALVLRRNESAVVEAARARQILGVTPEAQASWGSAKEALVQWRARLEDLGVLVLQFKMASEAASGFSLSETVPAIILNKSDHESRRCFTLFHEWAHLLLGEPGLCNVDEGRVAARRQDVEVYCDRFAAEALVPLDDLRASGIAARLAAGSVSLADAIDEGRARFGVSRWVVLIRLRDMQALTRAAFEETARAWTNEPYRQRGGRSRPPRQALQNLGLPYVSRVLAARESGEITDARASDYLGLKLRWFADLESLVPRGR